MSFEEVGQIIVWIVIFILAVNSLARIHFEDRLAYDEERRDGDGDGDGDGLD